jgi:Co-chaperonin GroES (HSP10)
MEQRVNFRPIKNRILAKQIFEEVKPVESASGLILGIGDEDHELVKNLVAKTDKLTPTNRLDILRVGKDCEEVVEGDTVIFDNRGTRIEHNGEKYILIEEKNVLGIIEA